MQTDKEAILASLRGEKADHITEAYSVMQDVVFPGDRYIGIGNAFDPYGTGPDAWGVLWTNQGPEPMFDGNMVAKDFILFDDMEEWKDHVHFPDLNQIHAKEALMGMAQAMHVDRENNVLSVLILSGEFERLNEMIGMEDALCAFYEYPDELEEFFEKMAEYKLKCIDLAYEALHPDVIHMHDDWGSEKNMFFSPELWRQYIKPVEKKLVERIHELGMLYMHHSCGYIKQIIPDLIEIGVDAIEPMMVCNGLEEILDEYGDQITFMGGINNRITDTPESTPEVIAAEVERAFKAYAHRGRYLPYYIPTDAQRYGIYANEVKKQAALLAAQA